MFLKQRKASTDPRLRSLLQKATRRGYVEVAALTAQKLFDVGDKTWLRSRTAVITFEECWPLGEDLQLDRGVGSKLHLLRQVCVAQKQKDAAGLGALAYASHDGDQSVQSSVEDFRSVRIVAEALSRPSEFFDWAVGQAKDERAVRLVLNARKYLPAATWGWDKTCILAGAYLATVHGVPKLPNQPRPPVGPFPFWVALDKHTPEGKVALKKVCSQFGVPYRQLIWAGFYYESAVTNAMSTSLWWEEEKSWRLRKTGLTLASAENLWMSVREALQKELDPMAKELEALIIPVSYPQAELLE